MLIALFLRSPLLAAAHRHSGRGSTFSDALETLRLFINSMDFAESSSDGWLVLSTLCDQAACLGGNKEEQICLFIWVLRVSIPDIRSNFIETQCSVLLNFSCYEELQEAADILLGIAPDRKLIDAVITPNGYTILHRRAAFAEVDLSPYFAKGPNLHRVGRDTRLSPEWETPMSLAMYSSWAFKLWLNALKASGMRFEDFIIQELEQGPLQNAGWNKESLLALFSLEFLSAIPPRDKEYGRCTTCFRELDVRVESSWVQRIVRIRSGADPDVQHNLWEDFWLCSDNDVFFDCSSSPLGTENENNEEREYEDDVLCIWCWKSSSSPHKS